MYIGNENYFHNTFKILTWQNISKILCTVSYTHLDVYKRQVLFVVTRELTHG